MRKLDTFLRIDDFVKTYAQLNRHNCEISRKLGEFINEIQMKFEITDQMAQMYTLLHNMLIEGVSLYIENNKTIKILIER